MQEFYFSVCFIAAGFLIALGYFCFCFPVLYGLQMNKLGIAAIGAILGMIAFGMAVYFAQLSVALSLS